MGVVVRQSMNKHVQYSGLVDTLCDKLDSTAINMRD